MIIDCISDLHGLKPILQGGDLLIIAGDLTSCDKHHQYESFFEWLAKQDYKKKVFISGNHDNQSMSQFDWLGADYLLDSGTEFNGLKIWGSPWSLWFHGVNPKCKAFMATEQILSDRYALIPDDVDILITHTPPYSILDDVEDYKFHQTGVVNYYGSTSLYDRLCNIRPSLHVFGHIHEQGGRQLTFKRPGHGDENNTICVNASIMGPTYKPDNEPVRIII